MPSTRGSAAQGQVRPRVTLVKDVLLEVLGSVILDSRAEGWFTVALLLVEPDLYWDLMRILYRKIRLTRVRTVGRLAAAFRLNPHLPSLVRQLRIVVAGPPLVEFFYSEVLGLTFQIPFVLAAVAPFIEHLGIQCRLHPDLLYVFRTTVFPKLVSMEVPCYLIMDKYRTIRLHARLRRSFRGLSLVPPSSGRSVRLTEASLKDCWPVLKRLSVRCKWGLYPAEIPMYDFSHLSSVEEMMVLLTERTWEANVAQFLAHIRVPPKVSVVALFLSNTTFIRNALFANHHFHPTVVVPVFGDPEASSYCGDPDFAYICNLVCLVKEKPREEGFWERMKEFQASRSLLPELFHTDRYQMMRWKDTD
ncbi:hypothetical protein VNI00_012685 [Paramarasmius palmivorus]|uniref:Uncharacterized protein n=1 Tax=Paramarasmius palmivorus TaxID=297713 RepID=A0AAW0C3A3_9AGAR